ncbi:hypothetical protein VPH35_017301 [Triticum aestivum]|uniref:Uncharacterized protein n=2 Tax=Aegilops tauschii subsp. strangulata TaxID=200361 RepID=A0A452ZZZ6_AEGTS|nr:uncharacterized protein LOC109740048 [Aegilops tauschii subsp. strangulata]XP_044447173.1 uncharacterized protein LOC123177551 [Triticum aestivum]
MGTSRSKPAREWPPAPPPEPRVEVPPLIEPPPNAARTSMQVPGYEQWFGKPSLRGLFDDYFNQAGSVNAGVMLKMLQDPHVDLTATASPAGGEAQLRWQSDLYNPGTVAHFLVSTAKPTLKLSVHFPEGGIGSFATIPLQAGNSMLSENNSVIGLRYDSQNLSLGASVVPFLLPGEEPSMVPYGAWLVGRIGGLSAGAQYKPLSDWLSTPTDGSMNCLPFEDLKNWDYAISYDVGSASPLSPSLNFSLELVRSTQLVASFYQHQVVLREVKGGPRFEDADEIVNYIDFGVELATRVGKDKPTDDADNSSFQIAANWQANKNFLVKGKLGPSKSSVALAFKSWWKPMFTFSFTAVNDHSKGTRGYGFGIHVDDQRDPDSSHLL